MISALRGEPIIIYGDGKQVRDLLYVEDLLHAFDAALANLDRMSGEIFNIGGGPQNTISVWAQFGPLLSRVVGRAIPVSFRPWRPGDQKVYITDIRKAKQLLGWRPTIGVNEGISYLFDWVKANGKLIEGVLAE